MALSGLTYLGYILFFAQEAFRWYLVFPTLTSVGMLLFLISKVNVANFVFLSFLRMTVLSIPVAVVSLNLAVMYKYFTYETVTGSLHKTVLDVNQHVPPQSKIGTHDAGVIGYFSTSHVHNLDGLINSKRNLDRFLKENKIIEYALFYKLNYLLVREGMLKHVEDSARLKGVTLERIKTYDVTRMDRLYLLKL